MPQPIKWSGAKFNTHPNNLRQRPQLALLIALVGAHWQKVENHFAQIFVTLLGGSQSAALDIFQNLIDRNMKKEAFVAVASGRVDQALIDQTVDLFQSARKLAKRRNAVVHGTWTILDRFPDALLLVDTSQANEFRHKSLEAMSKNKTFDRDSFVWTFLKYTAKDFDDIIQSILAFEEKVIDIDISLSDIFIQDVVKRRQLAAALLQGSTFPYGLGGVPAPQGLLPQSLSGEPQGQP